MNRTSAFIESLLNETLGYDMCEQYAALLYDWYGDDISLFNPDDEDLAIAFNRLRKTDLFWRTSPTAQSPYQKLSRKYDILLESYMQLLDVYKNVCAEISGTTKAFAVNNRKIVALKIKGKGWSATKTSGDLSGDNTAA